MAGSSGSSPMPEPFDRDATKEALPVVAQALMNGGVQGCDEFAAGAAVLDAARWAVAVTEGDGIWWCERHQCCWGYTPFCGWRGSGEACPKSRRLLIEWEADGVAAAVPAEPKEGE